MSINASLLRRSREIGLKLSPILEEALRLRIKEEEAAQWLSENKRAIDAYNEEIGESGVFSESSRSF